MATVKREEIYFANGATQLAGTLTLPATGFHGPAVIALHAAGEGERGFALYKHLAEVLSRRGVAVLTYDRRGSGHSSGDFARASFETLADDACAGLELLKGRRDIDGSRLGAWGVSQGGWLAPLVALKTRLKCLAIVSGAGVSPAQQMDYSAVYALREAGFSEAVVHRASELRRGVNAYYLGRLGRNRVQQEIDEVADQPWFSFAYVDRVLPDTVATSKWALEVAYDPLPAMMQSAVPTLLLYGETDPWIPVEESIKAWRAAAGRWVSVSQVPRSDHFMTLPDPRKPGERRIARGYTDALVRWFSTHL